MKITTKTTFDKFCDYAVTGFVAVEDFTALTSRPRPSSLCGVELPDNLDDITLLQLHKIRNITGSLADLLYIIEVLLDIPAVKLPKAPACDVLAVGGWVMSELTRISRMFEKIKASYSPEEITAGVKMLDFGYYGMADSYARRMGITDPDYVMTCVPWLKVWNASRMDNEIDRYHRRLQKVYQNKTKKK